MSLRRWFPSFRIRTMLTSSPAKFCPAHELRWFMCQVHGRRRRLLRPHCREVFYLYRTSWDLQHRYLGMEWLHQFVGWNQYLPKSRDTTNARTGAQRCVWTSSSRDCKASCWHKHVYAQPLPFECVLRCCRFPFLDFPRNYIHPPLVKCKCSPEKQWGQCGTTSEFCTNTRSNGAAPGTAAPGTNGCISNCGISIVKSAPPVDFRRIGYFQGYNLGRPCLNMDVRQIDTSKYTHIHFAFATLATNYAVVIGDTSTTFEFNSFKNLQGVSKILSIGGWTFSTTFSTYNIMRTGVTAANRVAMATSIANFVKSNGLDGVDIDWEYPWVSLLGLSTFLPQGLFFFGFTAPMLCGSTVLIQLGA